MSKVFIGCVKKKNAGRLKAKNKYASALFKYELAYAKKFVSEKDIYILSAKYGLITLDTVIDDYDLTLKYFSERQRKEWAYKVIMQANKFGINKNDEIIFLCGEHYSKYLKRYYKNHKDPTQGLCMGKTLKFYKDNI